MSQPVKGAALGSTGCRSRSVSKKASAVDVTRWEGLKHGREGSFLGGNNLR